MKTINHLEKIVALAKEKGLKKSFFKEAKEHLDAVGTLLEITPTQAALFALFFEHIGEGSISVGEIAKAIKCEKLQLLQYMDDLDVLRQKRLMRQRVDCFASSDSFADYVIPREVIDAVRKNVTYNCTAYSNLSPEDFFDHVEKLLNAAKNDDFTLEGLVEEVNYLLGRNRHIAFVRKTKEYDLKEASVLILFVFAVAYLHEDQESIEANELLREMRGIIGSHEAKAAMSRFESGEHKLFQKELVQNCYNKGLADTESYCLTSKMKSEFFSDLNLKRKSKYRGANFLKSEKITQKPLFYGENIRSRVAELTELLREENYVNIKKRLEEKGMRTGFACIFSGTPGTGKTETVYQIARATGRDIFLVDISETKSKWFGESEKRVKSLFDRYRGMVESCEIAPILLFNEADAVLGKRRELSENRSGVSQTENAIQNIILQEMENLTGILIATTNMTANLDKAFERRFLYKIEFEKPDTESKKLMWQSFMPSLCEDDAATLAKKFDFSGGQIENITRKSAVSYILKGEDPDLNGLEALCKEEILEKEAVRIGFLA
jgi:hypothetical protein